MKYTFRQLEYFIAAGETGSIAAASEKISVSSPSISTAISQLEHTFGVQLFVRHHAQGVSLTTGGRRLYAEAKKLLEQAEGLHDVARDITDKVRGPISVGCLVTISPYILPELRRGFEDVYPQAGFTQVESHQLELFRLLRSAEIDVAVSYDLELPTDVEFLPLVELPPQALFSADHPLAKESSATLETLAEYPMVLLDLPLSREYFLSMFMMKGLRPNIAERTTDLSMVRSLVANGFGYSLVNVPSMNTQSPDGKPLHSVVVEGDVRPVNLGLLTMGGGRTTRIREAFEEHCRGKIKNLVATGI